MGVEAEIMNEFGGYSTWPASHRKLHAYPVQHLATIIAVQYLDSNIAN
jgi:hypothetical protein